MGENEQHTGKFVRKARTNFNHIKEASELPDDINPFTDVSRELSFINRNLKKADADFAALDPEGKKTSEEMKQELEEASKVARIKTARNVFEGLENQGNPDGFNVQHSVDTIKEELTKAGVDASALDPEGKKSAEQMEKQIQKKMNEAYINEAKNQVDILKDPQGLHHGDYIESNHKKRIEVIEKNLDLAGSDYSVLDSKGKKSSEEMKQNVQELVKGAYIEDAKDRFQKLKSEESFNERKTGLYYNYEDEIQTIKDDLKEAGADYSALDPKGKKSSAQMEKELQKAEMKHKAFGIGKDLLDSFDELSKETSDSAPQHQRTKEGQRRF